MTKSKWLLIFIAVMIVTVLSGCESKLTGTSQAERETASEKEKPTHLVIQYSGGVVVNYWLAVESYVGQSGAGWKVPGGKSLYESLGEITSIPLDGRSEEQILTEYNLK